MESNAMTCPGERRSGGIETTPGAAHGKHPHGGEPGAHGAAPSTPARPASGPGPRNGRSRSRLRFLPVLALALLPGAFCLLAAAPAQAQTEETVWSAILNLREMFPGSPGYQVGCGSAGHSHPADSWCTSTLTDNSFSYGGYTFRIDRLFLTDNAALGNTGTKLLLALDKAVPASIENSLKLVVGNRDYEFKLAGAFGDTRIGASWTDVSIQGWRADAQVPVSLVRTNAPRFLTANEKNKKLEVVWQEPPGLVAGDRLAFVDITSSTSVGDYAATSPTGRYGNEASYAAGWVRAGSIPPPTTRFDLPNLVNDRKYRFRVRLGFADAQGRLAHGAWRHGEATPRERPPTIVRSLPETCRPPNADEIQTYLAGGDGRKAEDTPCVPVVSLLTGLEIKGVKADGTDTDPLPLSGGLANAVGLGGPGLYAIRVPPDVKKVKVKVTFTNTTSNLGFLASSFDVTGGAGFSSSVGWGIAESGETRELLLRPGTGVTRIRVYPVSVQGDYNIYAYHDKFADSANANLRTLKMNAGN